MDLSRPWLDHADAIYSVRYDVFIHSVLFCLFAHSMHV